MTERQLREDFVKLCRADVGLSNGGKCPETTANTYNEFIARNVKKFGNYPRTTRMALDWAWCCCQASVWGIKAGYAMSIMPVELSCCNAIREFMAMPSNGLDTEERSAVGRFVERDDYTPAPGDWVFFDWDGKTTSDSCGYATTDHVGIVTRVDGGKIYTVEGNRSKKVMEKCYDVGSYCISGYGVPDFASMATDEPVTELPELKRGSKCEAVKALQTLLNLRANAGLVIDGSFGQLTQAALNKWQSENGGYADGVCNAYDWLALIEG